MEETRETQSAPPDNPLWRRFRRGRGQLAIVLVAFGVGSQFGSRAEHTASGPSTDHAAHAPAKPVVWSCAMHPQIKLPAAGPCPICGMDLIPLVAESGDEAAPDKVIMSERGKALAQIETQAVQVSDTAVELRLLGRLAYNETKVRTITSWTDGRIDRLMVSAVGERVKAGQTIASLYSPEIYAARADLIQAKVQLDRLAAAPPIAKNAAQSALESSKMRLSLLGVSPGKVSTFHQASRPPRNVAVSARYSGTVIEQLVHEGAYIKAGAPIFKLANLSTIWAQLDAYEGDLPRIHKGDKVTLEIASMPGKRFKGKVSFVDPVVNPQTRTAKIRVVVSNKKRRLSPGMFADAIIHAPADSASRALLTIPISAPLFTGKRSVVYVEVPNRPKPTYEIRVVHLGGRAGNVYPVIDGLKAGERVVVQGAFALDADLQIRGGHSMMTMDDDVTREAREPVRVNERFKKGFARVLSAYLDLHDTLANDDVEGTQKALAELAKQAAGFDPRSPAKARRIYKKLGKKITAEARQAAKLDVLGALRIHYGRISTLMIDASLRFGNSTEDAIRLAYCPMALDGQGAHWLQRQQKVENPFFGAKMYTCGEIRHTTEGDERFPPDVLNRPAPKP